MLASFLPVLGFDSYFAFHSLTLHSHKPGTHGDIRILSPSFDLLRETALPDNSGEITSMFVGADGLAGIATSHGIFTLTLSQTTLDFSTVELASMVLSVFSHSLSHILNEFASISVSRFRDHTLGSLAHSNKPCCRLS
jgi:hypothetical protein